MNARDIPTPEQPVLRSLVRSGMASSHIRSAMLHVVSLAHWAIIYTRSMAADSKLQRVRLAGELERARNEITLLREEIRIKDERMARIPPKNRPYYSPFERLAILELKSMRGWNLRQTAEHFMVEEETISEWMKRLEDDSLIRTPEPINKFPAFVKYVVQRMKILCPVMGKKRIAEMLARAGLQLSASTVSRLLNLVMPQKTSPKTSRNAPPNLARPGHFFCLQGWDREHVERFKG